MAQWRSLISPEDLAAFDLQKARLLEGRLPLLQTRIRVAHADGHWLHAAVRGKVAQWDETGRPIKVVGLLIDITESWHREEALNETQKLESLGLLAGAISHDFNNLLMAMGGHAQVALERLEDGEDPHDNLVRLQSVIEKSRDLVKQLLDYSGRGDRRVERLDLSELTQEMTGLMAISVPKRIRLHVDTSKGLPPIEGDRSKLQQVVLNLVTNAADAIGDMEGHIRVRTRLKNLDPDQRAPHLPDDLDRADTFVMLEVEDSGCGMDEATQKRIFDPFFTTKRKGRGLGLSVMQGIVRSHGGALSVRSAPGEGSTFRILLPALR
jgi:signal transduction histidine kinase